MKKRIAFLAAGTLLTLGTAVAGTFFYGHEAGGETISITLPSDNDSSAQEVTPEMIAMWKATAASTDYDTTKAPI